MTPEARALIVAHFPNLQSDEFVVTSPPTRDYNCVAWAAGDMGEWWWPSADDFWPNGVPRVNTVDSFILAFRLLGYEICDDGNFEIDIEKVALYANANGPQHMSRQLAPGAWTSKLGSEWDIEHPTVHSLEGGTYGEAVLFLRRPRGFKAELLHAESQA